MPPMLRIQSGSCQRQRYPLPSYAKHKPKGLYSNFYFINQQKTAREYSTMILIIFSKLQEYYNKEPKPYIECKALGCVDYTTHLNQNSEPPNFVSMTPLLWLRFLSCRALYSNKTAKQIVFLHFQGMTNLALFEYANDKMDPTWHFVLPK